MRYPTRASVRRSRSSPRERPLVGQVVDEEGDVPGAGKDANPHVDEVVDRRLRVEPERVLRERGADRIREREKIADAKAVRLVTDLGEARSDVLKGAAQLAHQPPISHRHVAAAVACRLRMSRGAQIGAGERPGPRDSAWAASTIRSTSVPEPAGHCVSRLRLPGVSTAAPPAGTQSAEVMVAEGGHDGAAVAADDLHSFLRSQVEAFPAEPVNLLLRIPVESDQ